MLQEDLAGFLFILFVLCVIFGTVAWAYGDAVRRGKSGWLVALMVLLLTWPIGLVIWLVVRPEQRHC